MSRGRGRGRGGGQRREISGLQSELTGVNLPDPPPELFPKFDVPAVRSTTTEEKHINALMNKFRTDIKASVFYLQPPSPPREIERYSDRYFTGAKEASLKDVKTDLLLFPEELQQVLSKRKIKRAKATAESSEDVLKMLDKVKDSEGKEGEKEGEEEASDEGEELVEEEDDEEENDYMDTYFDNGEGDDIGDMDDDDEGGGGDY
ncbi:hypothetical protein LPJ63_001740 [Coemansia sp. RSA 2711]|nr:hypothetical protein LPJ63_001740 [Coemansia sp. RSA 2711]KAJ2309952.1 hypothetical protein IWW54_003461 [Coemansia sp. RSA 2705]KAJ2370815.1 hypothetical protein H4S01_000019 [Coemansia sp. RSA 2610]KAJ2385677.1 hypothetical protein H4S02_004217 [Coemansia sp. RSA 2611]